MAENILGSKDFAKANGLSERFDNGFIRFFALLIFHFK